MADPRDPRYPIGEFVTPETITPEDLRFAIQTLAEMPALLRESLRDLDEEQLNTPYRDDGWTVRQLVHHIADSHMTAFHRFRKALTEDWPTVTGYDEKAFAKLHDSAAPVEWSVDVLEGVHARWIMLLQSMGSPQFQRGYNHAERGPTTLAVAAMHYAWHAGHHVAHITVLRSQRGW